MGYINRDGVFEGLCIGGALEGQYRVEPQSVLEVPILTSWRSLSLGHKEAITGMDIYRHIALPYYKSEKGKSSTEIYNFWVHQSIKEGEELDYIFHRLADLSEMINNCPECQPTSRDY